MKTRAYHKVVKWGLVMGILFFSISVGYGQAVPPPIPPPPPPGLPIDGGIGFLLIVGALFGAKRYKDSSS